MKKMLLFISCTFVFFAVNAQNLSDFTFSSNVKDWSNTVTRKLQSVKMEKNNIPPVELAMRVQLKKKMMLACHYNVEYTNKSDKKVSFKVYNDYTDATGKTIYHKVSLKPGETKVVKIIYSSLSCKVKEESECPKCGWTFRYADISVK